MNGKTCRGRGQDSCPTAVTAAVGARTIST